MNKDIPMHTIINDIEVISKAISKDHARYYLCKCKVCGKEQYIREYALLHNSNTSKCKEKTYRIDYSGKYVADYKVNVPSGHKNRYTVWECECIYCGKPTDITSKQLRSKKIRVCSCQKERNYKARQADVDSKLIAQLVDMTE